MAIIIMLILLSCKIFLPIILSLLLPSALGEYLPSEEYFSDTGLLYNTPSLFGMTPPLSFLIESNLYQNSCFKSLITSKPKDLSLSSQQPLSTATSCSALASLFSDLSDSIYFTISPSSPSAFTPLSCHPNTAGLIGIITVNPLLLESLAESTSLEQLSLSISEVSHSPRTHAFIKSGSVCQSGYFSPSSESCVQNRVRRQSASDYTNCMDDPSNTTPGCIVVFISQVPEELDAPTFAQMVKDLIGWSRNDIAIYGEAYNDICSFETTGEAILALLGFQELLSEATAADLQALLAGAIVETPDQYCGDGSLPIINFIAAHEQILGYLSTVLVADLSNSSYKTFVATADSQINQLMANFMDNGNQTPGFAQDFQSGLSSPQYIDIDLRVDTGDNFSCSCAFCVNTNVLLQVHVKYINLGSFADIWSINLYQSGTVDYSGLTPTYNLGEAPSPLSPVPIDTPNCYVASLSDTFEADVPYDWSCDGSAYCKVKAIITTSFEVTLKKFGLYEISKVCESGQGINDSNKCAPCGEQCTCKIAGGCDACISESAYINAGRCLPCDKSCQTCDGGLSSDCLTCPAELQPKTICLG